MNVLFTTDEEGSGLIATRRLLDRYLQRVSSKAWAGTIHTDLFEILFNEIKDRKIDVAITKFTKNGPVPIYISPASGLNRFNHVISTRKKRMSYPEKEDPRNIIYAIAMLSAVFHDFGKVMKGFQSNLRKRTPQLVRHEFMSFIVFSWLTRQDSPFNDDLKLIQAMSDNTEWLDEVNLFLNKLANEDEQILQFIRKIMSTDVFSDTDSSGIFSDRKIIECVKFVILTHHKMITYKNHENGPCYNSENKLESFVRTSLYPISDEALEFIKPFTGGKAFSFLPVGKKYTIMNRRFLSVVSSTCSEMIPYIAENLKEGMNRSLLTDIGLIARNFMIIGDNKGSSIKIAGNGSKSGMVFANTDGNALADLLVCHLTRVVIYTHKALKSIQSGFDKSISEEDIPEMLSERSPEKFQWQNKAIEITRDYTSGGFIAFVIAGTGSGKTIADMKILASVSNNLRTTILLPLRTLTKQTFNSYRKDMHFTACQAAIIMGGMISPRLTTIEAHKTGIINLSNDIDPVENDETFDNTSFDIEVDVAANDLVIPDILHTSKNKKAMDVFLTYPLVACTSDMLIPGVNLSHKNGMTTYLRSITSDLIIDEIDAYSHEDQIVLCRLVYQAGLFGKKVIISSATISPGLVEQIKRNYEAGFRNHNQFWNKDKLVSVAMVSEFSADMVNIQDFDRAYPAFLDSHITSMISSEPRRRMNVFDFSNDEESSWRNDLLVQAMRLHETNYIPGSRSSVGLIRLNRVRDVIDMSRYLLNGVDIPDNVRVVCMHSRYPAIVKENLERELAILLSRKENSPLEKSEFQKHKRNDLMVIVVASDIVETGRDFDFDWAITEPCSEHSIVQLAGRVRRHRYSAYDNINMLMSSETIKNFLAHSTINSKGYNRGAISKPGVDTAIQSGPIAGDVFSWPNEKIDPTTRRAEKLFDLKTLNEKIDSRFLVSYETENSPFNVKRTAMISDIALGNRKDITDDLYPLSSDSYLSNDVSRRNSRMYSNRLFRRQEGQKDATLEFKGDGIDVILPSFHVLKEKADRLFFSPQVYYLSGSMSSSGRKLTIPRYIYDDSGDYGVFTGLREVTKP